LNHVKDCEEIWRGDFGLDAINRQEVQHRIRVGS
jgi:hypothetical protein